MKTIQLNQLLELAASKSMKDLIYQQQEQFIQKYELASVLNEEVKLVFETAQDAQTFYYDCQIGHQFLKNVQVLHDVTDEKVLILRPIQAIISLLKDKKFSLLTLSKTLDLNFKLMYTQAFTNHHLSLYIHQGKIVNPSCTLYLNPDHTTFALGRLYKLMNNEDDFYQLNTTIQLVRSEVICESNRISH